MLSLMQILIIIAIALHAVSAVFWMGSSMSLARPGAMGEKIFFPRQMMAALIATLTGGFLWSQLHTGGFGPYEMVLAIGAVLAVIAAGIQGVVVGGSLRRLKTGGNTEVLQKRIMTGYRAGGGLLALCLICMVIARFV